MNLPLAYPFPSPLTHEDALISALKCRGVPLVELKNIDDTISSISTILM